MGLLVLSENPSQAFFSALGYNRQKGMLGGHYGYHEVYS